MIKKFLSVLKKRDLKIRDLYRIQGKRVQIDIRISSYQDFFSDWDYSPIKMRDLNDDLFSYLLECSMEIPQKYPLDIVLHIPEGVKNEKKELSNRTSYRNYLLYRHRLCLRERQNSYIRMVWFFLFGVLFIGIGYFLEGHERFAVIKILKEGFFIGGWVLFWELFSSLFFNIRELDKRISMVNRLVKAGLEFHYH